MIISYNTGTCELCLSECEHKHNARIPLCEKCKNDYSDIYAKLKKSIKNNDDKLVAEYAKEIAQYLKRYHLNL